MARKRKYIDRKLLKALCLSQLTDEEIATCLRVDRTTLWRRYATAIKEWKSQGVASMRRNLYTRALDGDNACLIFFLKNFAGMSDKHEHSGPNGQPIPVQHLDGLTADQLAEIERVIESATPAGTSKG